MNHTEPHRLDRIKGSLKYRMKKKSRIARIKWIAVEMRKQAPVQWFRHLRTFIQKEKQGKRGDGETLQCKANEPGVSSTLFGGCRECGERIR